jgi:cell fate (sporulation/competence/biofilm development) regulator YlbF (YheA/YmcA/DUF963 family)
MIKINRLGNALKGFNEYKEYKEKLEVAYKNEENKKIIEDFRKKCFDYK